MRGPAVRGRGGVQGNEGSEIELESMFDRAQNKRPQLLAVASADTRNAFITKVYGILCAQLLLTLVVAGTCAHFGKAWLKSNPSAVFAALALSSAASLSIAMICACCPKAMQQFPTNYAILGFFTIAESVLCGFACLRYTAGSVLLCIGITAFVVFCLTIYAVRTKSDMTTMGPYLFGFLCVLCGTGFLMWVLAACGFSHSPFFGAMQLLYAGAGALIFSLFIVYDTQMIVGGGHKHEFSIDDYAMAAMCLYLDILQLFLELLQILGRADDSGL